MARNNTYRRPQSYTVARTDDYEAIAALRGVGCGSLIVRRLSDMASVHLQGDDAYSLMDELDCCDSGAIVDCILSAYEEVMELDFASDSESEF